MQVVKTVNAFCQKATGGRDFELCWQEVMCQSTCVCCSWKLNNGRCDSWLGARQPKYVTAHTWNTDCHTCLGGRRLSSIESGGTEEAEAVPNDPGLDVHPSEVELEMNFERVLSTDRQLRRMAKCA